MNTDETLQVNAMARYKCLSSLLFFTRYFYKHRFNRKFVVGEHHQTICNLLEDVLAGRTTRAIINIAPRYSKTELAVKNFIAHGLAINPAAKFIHLTYADKLALDNSEEARELVSTPEYQELFPEVQIRKGSDAKNKWYTTAGGGVYAAAAGGQVTGFGAGKVDVEEGDEDGTINEWLEALQMSKAAFAGAIIIDDPVKPEDATSGVKREKVNQRFESTIRSRVNSRNTPIIVIQQRVHEHDLSGYLLEVEPLIWKVLSLPALREDGTALWPFKHTVDELLKLQQVNDYVFETQYQQNPKPMAGLVYSGWVRMENDDFPEDCNSIVIGQDFGFTNDPSGGVKVARKGDCIYVHELCYKPGIDAPTMREIYKAAGVDIGNTPVYCDHNPDMISSLRREGVILAKNARKGEGSINTGILRLKQFKVYYTRSSVNIHTELLRYAWEVDPTTGKPTNTPIDQWNHLMDAIRYAVYSHWPAN